VVEIPRRDGAVPQGQGAMAGRGVRGSGIEQLSGMIDKKIR